MHEGSIASAIVRSVLEQASRRHADEIVSITLAIGKLTFISQTQLLFWLENGFENTAADGAQIEIDEIPGVYQCHACQHVGEIDLVDDPAYHLTLPHFACTVCQSHDIEIVKGKEMVIRRIQIKQK